MGILTRNTCGFLLLAFLVRCTEPSAPASDTTDAVALSDYQRAESFLSPNTRELVSGEILVQYWQPDDRLIFQRSTPEGSEYQIFDSATGNTTALFDEVLFTRALAEFSDAELDANDLTLRDLKVNDTLDTLTFRHDGNEYSLDLLTMALEQLPESAEDEFLSPDRRWAAYIDDFNLWVFFSKYCFIAFNPLKYGRSWKCTQYDFTLATNGLGQHFAAHATRVETIDSKEC